MLSFWLPGVEPAWLSALFALGFALAARSPTLPHGRVAPRSRTR